MQSWCWKSRQGQAALYRTKGYISRKQIRTKKVTSKLEQGLNFTVNGDFWFCNDRWFLKKKSWRQKTGFLSFFYEVKNGHFCSDLVQIQKVIFCKKRFFGLFRISQFEEHSTQFSSWQLRQCSRDWKSCNVLKQCSLVRPVLAGRAFNGLL